MKTTLCAILLGACVAWPTTAARAEAAQPSYTSQVRSMLVFAFPTEWVGPEAPPESESAELLRAMKGFATDRGAALESFVASHPQSAWTPSLQVNLAGFYAKQGRYTLALARYEAAWATTRNCTNTMGQKLAARNAAAWAALLADLGQQAKLESLLKDIDQSHVTLGAYSSVVSGARVRLDTMQYRPDRAFKCGLLALEQLAGALHAETTLSRYMLNTASPEGGFTLSQLLTLGQTNGLPLEAVRRPHGAEMVAPCIIHWKFNHYALVAEARDGRYRIADPNSRRSIWVTPAAMEEEGSGVFLVPRGKAPAAWVRLTKAECGEIRGGCYGPPPDDGEDDCDPCDGGDEISCPPCDPPAANDGASGVGSPSCPSSGSNDVSGMARWEVSEPYINLWIKDTPLRYRLSSGQWMSFHLSYKQRGSQDEIDRGNNSQLPGFGPNWSCNWIGIVNADSTPTNFLYFEPGGGARSFVPTVADYKSACTMMMCSMGGSSSDIATSEDSGGGSWLQSPPSYPVLTSPFALQNFYASSVGCLDGSANYLLTRRADQYGRIVEFHYQAAQSCVQLANVVDVDGRSITITYTNTQFPNLITSITDPYNRTCYFYYDTSGRLSSVTDTIGMSSSFRYDGSNLVTALTTPYGTTHFTSYEGPVTLRTGAYSQNRALLVNEADGSSQLYAYCGEGPADYSGGDQEAAVRNSYHWNRAQFNAIPAQDLANPLYLAQDTDYYLGSIKHWLHADSALSQVCDFLSSMAEAVDPSPAGQRQGARSFSYYHQYEVNCAGIDMNVGVLKRVTEVYNADESVTYADIGYNPVGRPTSITKHNSDGSTASYNNYFDSSGTYLLSETGPRDEPTRNYGYDDPAVTNLLTSVTDALGDVITYTHEHYTMKVTSIAFPGGLVRTNIYYASGPSQGFLQMQADYMPGGNGIRTNYFSYINGNVFIQTNELGLATTNTWDNLNRLVSTAYPDGTTVSNVYDRLDLVAQKDRLNQWTYYTYNPVRQLMTVTSPNNQVTTYTYCGCGAPSSVTRSTGGRALTTLFDYDMAGRLRTTTYPDQYQTTRTYDDQNNLQSIADSAGYQVELGYAQLGLHYAVSNAYMVSSSGGPMLTLSRFFDEYGRVTNSTDGNGVTVTNDYDFLNRMIARQAFGPSGAIESGPEAFVYDALGLTNYFDPLGRLTVYVRDGAGRVVYQTNANNEVVSYAYNPADEMLSLIDGNTNSTTWKYDCYGQVTNKQDANGVDMFRYRYDANGRLTNRWHAGNINTRYAYDPVGNLTNVAYPSSAIAYTYDGLNRLVGMQDATGTTAFSWTDGNQLAGETGPWGADALTYTYVAAGVVTRQRQSLTLQQPGAGFWTQTNGYDSYGRLTSVTSPAGAFGYQYDPIFLASGQATLSSWVQQLTYPNGAYDQRTYDGVGDLTLTALTNSTGTTLLDSRGYGYDLGGQRWYQTFTAGNVVLYTYDNIGQLKTANGLDPYATPRLQEQFGYAYDAGWNLSWRTNYTLVENFAVNNLNELASASRSGGLTVAGATTLPGASVTVNGSNAAVYLDNTFAATNITVPPGQSTLITAVANDGNGNQASANITVNLPAGLSYQYDSRGNLTSDGLRTFAYDAENQLTNVYVPGQWRSDFVYDGLMRRRIRREYAWQSGAWSLQTEIHYVYDGRLVIQERDANSVPLVTYTRGKDLSGSLEGAGGIGGLLARSDNSAMGMLYAGAGHAYYHHDGNGNVTCLFNSGNQVVAAYSYDPFGNVLVKSGPLADVNLYRFSDKEFHTNSGLVYYLYRYYEPNLQRWVNRDPIAERGGINLFASFRNGPLRSFDPEGLFDCTVTQDQFGLWIVARVPSPDLLPVPFDPPSGLDNTPFILAIAGLASAPALESGAMGAGESLYTYAGAQVLRHPMVKFWAATGLSFALSQAGYKAPPSYTAPFDTQGNPNAGFWTGAADFTVNQAQGAAAAIASMMPSNESANATPGSSSSPAGSPLNNIPYSGSDINAPTACSCSTCSGGQ
jgi:RHS repeat-associated protein